jgi:YHS domain-containing protein
MEWLNQNWTYPLLLVGVILFMRFAGMGCGFGGRRTHPSSASTHPGGRDTSLDSAAPTDPVSGRPVDPKTAVATIHHGQPVYFESRENRDRFEAAPDQFAPGADGDGTQKGARHSHRSCC